MIATEVVEQRLSHFMMGLVIIGTMTGPLLIVLHTIPRSLFAGVFLVVGVGILSVKTPLASNRTHDQRANFPFHDYSGALSNRTAS